MAQTPKKRRSKKDETDHDMMERLFGKRVMKEVDRIVAERSQDADPKEVSGSMQS